MVNVDMAPEQQAASDSSDYSDSDSDGEDEFTDGYSPYPDAAVVAIADADAGSVVSSGEEESHLDDLFGMP